MIPCGYLIIKVRRGLQLVDLAFACHKALQPPTSEVTTSSPLFDEPESSIASLLTTETALTATVLHLLYRDLQELLPRLHRLLEHVRNEDRLSAKGLFVYPSLSNSSRGK